MSGFIPTSHRERVAMLADVGLPEPERLFNAIPAELRLRELPLGPDLGEPLSELAIGRQLRELADVNLPAAEPVAGASGHDRELRPTAP